MSNYTFGQAAKTEDAFREITSNEKVSILRRKINNGDNFFWLLPANAESKNSVPWSYYTAHYEPYSICRRSRPVATYENGAEQVKRTGKIEECPRCKANWDQYGWKKPSNNAEWRQTPAYQAWRRDNPRERVMIPVVPVDFLAETRKGRTGKDEVVWREDAPAIFERFVQEFTEFLDSPTWKEREEGTYPGFEFSFRGADGKETTVITGVQTIEWSAHEFVVNSKLHFTLAEEFIEKDKSFSVEENNGKLIIPALLHIQRVSGKAFHDTKYRASIATAKGEAPAIPTKLLDMLNPILPDTFALTEPPSEEAMLESMARNPRADMEEDASETFAQSSVNNQSGRGSVLDGLEDDDMNLSGFDED